MSKISKEKEEKIMSDILSALFNSSPKAVFTSEISKTLARDEEYIKRLLLAMEKKNLVVSVKKNPQGEDYFRRIRWRLNNQAYDAYKKINSLNNISNNKI